MTILVLLQVCLAPVMLSAQTAVPKPVTPADFSSPPIFQWRDIRSVEACHAAVRYVQDSVRQFWRSDTLYADEDRPTPPAVVTVAQQCLDRFPIATSDTLELSVAMQLALLTGDTLPVRATIDRLLALRTAPRERAKLLFDGLSDAKRLLRPISIPFMQSFVAQLDSLGPEARREQASGRLTIAGSIRYRGVSPDSMLVLMQDVLAAYQRIPTTGLTPALTENIARGIDELKKDIVWYTYLRDGTTARFQEWAEANTKSGKPDIVGRLAPAIEGEFWIGRPKSNGTAQSGSQSNAPTPGRTPFPGSITLVVGARAEAQQQAKEWDLLRRVHQRFPEVKIVMLAQTAGMVWGKIRADDPAREAELLGQFYLDSLKLPVWLNVSKSMIDTTRRNSNGVPAIFASNTFEAWSYGSAVNYFYVLNRQGYVVNKFFTTFEIKELFFVLERLLQFTESPGIPKE